jgi:isoleucyl-tRNA synthetase
MQDKEEEKKIQEFWEKSRIFEKLRKKNKGKKRWSFLDGPLTANNPMGVHHAWGRTYKDLFQRFKAMQGYDQRFQNGFDCQGLWVEREEEKDLGLKNKQEIEKFGILNFVNACRKRVEKFSKIQTEQSKKLGQWMDWENSYYTMSDANNLHNWFLLKRYFEKGWLYKGEDAVPWCWRCGTASSKQDILTEGYREVTHKAIFMQFPVKGKKNEYFLIFTTTPWTIPANVAIAVNEGIDYAKAKQGDKYYWLAESRLSELKGEYKITEKKKGRGLEGIKYEMPYKDLLPQKNSPHKVVLWELASGEEGTGIVHIAPGCGAEDYELGKRSGLPAISPLDESGTYLGNFEEFSNKKYSKVNQEVLEDLEKRGFIYKAEPYKHRYPHCWRCGEELVFRLVDEWYVKCDEIREKLIKENKKIEWFPEYGKTRQEDWFKNMSDWLISRKRYWGLPLPIWECSCGNIEVIGSLKELREKAVDKKKVDSLPEIHRPWVDEIKIKCRKCGKDVKRIPDVGDAWLDAGIVPFSTIGPYLEKKEEWEKWFPADFICENMPGQYRGWFNALMWASVTLAEKSPFKSILGYETVKDEKGEEMHKSKGNVIWFDEAVERIGADPMRLLYCLQDPSQELRFGFNAVKEPKNNINILYNLSKLIESSKDKKISKVEDRWILSKLNSLKREITEELERLHPHIAARALQEFWLNHLSRGYVQMVRDRISLGDDEVKYILKEVYLELIKLAAPFIPYITERVWQDLREKRIITEESVHLSDWPKADDKKIDKKLEEDMQEVLKIIEKGMAERDNLKIGLKWPLSKAKITCKEKLKDEMLEIIKRQLNVKKAEIKKGGEIAVELDTKMTPELEAEGYAREIIRRIQDARKKAGLQKQQKIDLLLLVDKNMKTGLQKHREMLAERANARNFEIKDIVDKTAVLGKYKLTIEADIRNKKIIFGFNIL